MPLRINEKIMSTVIRTRDPSRQLLQHQMAILFLTFLIYATYHMSRKPMSVVKSKLYQVNTTSPKNWPPFDGPNGKTILSMMDAIYWGTYAVCMFLSGFLVERSDLRYFLSSSLTLCGLLCIISGMAYPLKIHSLTFFVIMQLLNGAMQTTGWPTVFAIVAGWFSSSKRGLIFGIWNLHSSIGNILGLTIAGTFVDINWGLSFMVPGFICIGVSILTFLFVIPKPTIGINVNTISSAVSEDENFQNPKNATPNLEESDEDKNCGDNVNKQAIGLWQALKIPGVIEFSICLAFTKSVSYIFLNWLPKYLEENNHLTSSFSAYISIMFDIGGMVGSIIIGLLAYLTDASSLTCIGFLAMAIPSLFILNKFSHLSTFLSLTLQFIAGFFINGPYTLITTTISASLASKVPSHSAMATVSAIVDGTGSIGAAIGPAITGPLADHFGWKSMFYMSMLVDFIALLCLIRVGYEEFQQIQTRRKTVTRKNQENY